MINYKVFNDNHIGQLHRTFEKAQPFKHVVIDNFLQYEFAEELSNNFPPIEKMNVHYKGINERKSEHSDFSKINPCFSILKTQLAEINFTHAIERICNIQPLEQINDRYGSGLHQGSCGSFLDIHIDYNIHPIQKKNKDG